LAENSCLTCATDSSMRALSRRNVSLAICAPTPTPTPTRESSMRQPWSDVASLSLSRLPPPRLLLPASLPQLSPPGPLSSSLSTFSFPPFRSLCVTMRARAHAKKRRLSRAWRMHFYLSVRLFASLLPGPTSHSSLALGVCMRRAGQRAARARANTHTQGRQAREWCHLFQQRGVFGSSALPLVGQGLCGHAAAPGPWRTTDADMAPHIQRARVDARATARSDTRMTCLARAGTRAQTHHGRDWRCERNPWLLKHKSTPQRGPSARRTPRLQAAGRLHR